METESIEPEVIYHYTTMDTLLKIADSKTIWASSVDYLNDTSEGMHFVEQIRNRLSGFSEQHGYGDEFIVEMTTVAKGETSFQMRPFVASFSAEDDSLPRWRSYCPNGNGVAIGFSVDCLERVCFARIGDDDTHKIAVGFNQVKYSDKVLPDAIVDGEIEAMIKATDGLIEFIKKDGEKPRLSREAIFSVLVEAQASYRKHISFSHEREFRIVLNPPILPPKIPLDFRPVRTTLVPFVKLRIPEKRAGFEQFQFEDSSPISSLLGRRRFQFIDRVVIGPTPNMSLSRQAVQECFREMRLDVDVEPSAIPFRDW